MKILQSLRLSLRLFNDRRNLFTPEAIKVFKTGLKSVIFTGSLTLFDFLLRLSILLEIFLLAITLLIAISVLAIFIIELYDFKFGYRSNELGRFVGRQELNHE